MRACLCAALLLAAQPARSREVEFPRARSLTLYERAATKRRLTLLPEKLGDDMRKVFAVMRKAGCALADPSGGYDPNKDGICDSMWRCPNEKVEAVVEAIEGVTGIRDDEGPSQNEVMRSPKEDIRRLEENRAAALEIAERLQAAVKSLERSTLRVPATCALAFSEHRAFKTYADSVAQALETTSIRLIFNPFRPSEEMLAEGRQACLAVRFSDAASSMGHGPAGLSLQVDPTKMAPSQSLSSGRTAAPGDRHFRACGIRWEGEPWEDLSYSPECARLRHQSFVVHSPDPDAAQMRIENAVGIRFRTACGFVPFPAKECGSRRRWLHYRIEKDKVQEFTAALAAASTLAPLDSGTRDTDPRSALKKEREALTRTTAAEDLGSLVDFTLKTVAGPAPDGGMRATVLLCPGRAAVSASPAP